MQLLTKEWNDPGNTPEEKSVLENAIQRAEFRYIDATKSETDRMLDAIGVARFTTQDIVNAIHYPRWTEPRRKAGLFACPETRKISPHTGLAFSRGI